MGHAKWVMPRGACKIESLGNDNTIVQYQGPVPPQMFKQQLILQKHTLSEICYVKKWDNIWYSRSI